MGRAGTGVASPCEDGSAVFYNPAGIAGMRGWTVSGGLTVISAYGDFTADLTGERTDLANSPILVPHVYAVYGITDRLAAGIGGFVPYGLGTTWPVEFEGRFNGYDNDLQSIYVQPTLAYRINDMVAVGAGFDFVIGSLELNQRLDLSVQPAPAPAPAGTRLGQLGVPFHTDFASAELKATGATGFGGNFGVWVTPVEGVDIGVRYLTRVKLDYEGTATFEPEATGITLPADNPFGVPGGTPLDAVVAGLNLFSAGQLLDDQTVTATIRMPEQYTVGVAIDVSAALKVLAEWQYVNWSVFDRIEADFAIAPDLTLEENYDDTNGFRGGFEWKASSKLVLRGGYLFHEGAAPPETVTPLLPEANRNEFTAGVGYRFSDRFLIDLAYQFLAQDQRRGRVREPLPGNSPTVALNSGLYSFNAHLFGATVTAHF